MCCPRPTHHVHQYYLNSCSVPRPPLSFGGIAAARPSAPPAAGTAPRTGRAPSGPSGREEAAEPPTGHGRHFLTLASTTCCNAALCKNSEAPEPTEGNGKRGVSSSYVAVAFSSTFRERYARHESGGESVEEPEQSESPFAIVESRDGGNSKPAGRRQFEFSRFSQSPRKWVCKSDRRDRQRCPHTT